MRHSDIKLTMGTYTDPALLGVREAMERLPSLNPTETIMKNEVPPKRPPTRGKQGQNLAIPDKMARQLDEGSHGNGIDGTPL